MIKIKKIKKKNIIFLYSFFCKLKFFYIDKSIIIPQNIKINIKKNNIFFNSYLGTVKFIFLYNIYIFCRYNKIYISIINLDNKKKKLKLYTKIIKIKFKGILQGFKIILIIKGLGFKVNIKKEKIILKLGFSHNIIIKIPYNIKIIIKKYRLTLYNINYNYLTQFIYYLKSFKKINMYKEKGLLLKNEKIILKEGKKNKN